MKSAWLVPLLTVSFVAAAGQNAKAPLFFSPQEDFSEQEGVLTALEETQEGAPRRWKETEVRCGVLTVDAAAKRPREIGDYGIGRPCRIARPYLETERFRYADAAWDLCGFTNATTDEKHEAFVKKVLAPNVGNFVCFQGANGGLGQFKVYRYVKLKEYRKY